jgi:hypothetical protein
MGILSFPFPARVYLEDRYFPSYPPTLLRKSNGNTSLAGILS